MSFIRKNIWGVGLFVVLILALAAMAISSRNSTLPSPTATAKSSYDFVFTPDEHIEGPANAKVTLVEFSDFQCPACGAYYPVIEEIVKAYPNDLRLVYKHFPLKTIHFRAEAGAFASEAAANQGKFWEMYNLLFQNQKVWSQQSGTTAFEAYAQKIGLDVAKFKTDMDSDAVKNKVRDAEKFGVDLGINSTPTFYLNGKKIENPQNFEEFKSIIANAVKAAQ